MFIPEYTPALLAHALKKTLEKIKSDTFSKDYSKEKIQWIKDTSDAIVDVIEMQLNKFNKKNPKGTIMSNDIVSALETTLQRFLKAIKQENKKT